MKGIIYYTDNRYLDPPIYPVAQRFILGSGLPITSVSLRPIDFGKNFVLNRKRGMYTMILQIIMALENSEADHVFFCEHDVLYPKSHFDFTPPRDDTYYYNTNAWRWRYHTRQVVTFKGLASLSSMCCNRKLALEHFKFRKKYVEDNKFDMESTGETSWSRHMAYEPGLKKRSYFPDELADFWHSEFPLVDIRHRFCTTVRKTTLAEFNCPPEDLPEITPDQVPGWDLEKLFEGHLFYK